MAQVIPIISVIASVASTAVSVYSAVTSGGEASKAEDRNAAVLAEQAAQARKAAALKAADEEKRHRRIISTQQAGYAGQGLEPEGTPLLVQMESLKESEEQLRRIREGGEIEATGLLEESKWREYLGGKAKEASYWTAGQSLLKGASGIYSMGKERSWWS